MVLGESTKEAKEKKGGQGSLAPLRSRKGVKRKKKR